MLVTNFSDHSTMACKEKSCRETEPQWSWNGQIFIIIIYCYNHFEQKLLIAPLTFETGANLEFFFTAKLFLNYILVTRQVCHTLKCSKIYILYWMKDQNGNLFLGQKDTHLSIILIEWKVTDRGIKSLEKLS